uniref:Uncharacterized protein n=1 Tax=Rhizophora mucronata TaxID=61149 RepID=A0A2P2N5S0_RHIMU
MLFFFTILFPLFLSFFFLFVVLVVIGHSFWHNALSSSGAALWRFSKISHLFFISKKNICTIPSKIIQLYQIS